MKLKRIIYLISFLFIITLLTAEEHRSDNSLTVTKNIDFSIEITDGIAINPAEINFGSIVRGTKGVRKKTENLKFNTSFSEDVEIQIKFLEDLSPEDEKFAKYKLILKNDENSNDAIEENTIEENTIDVYLEKIDKLYLRKGEVDIPINAEIREVRENIKLGMYEKNIQVYVFVQTIDSEG